MPGILGRGEETFLRNMSMLPVERWDQRYQQTKKIRDLLIRECFGKLEFLEYGARFNRRITSVCWHPKFPFTYAVGSKFGDITVGGIKRLSTSNNYNAVSLQMKVEVDGMGAGGAITAMQFDETDPNILYRVAIDSVVSRMDLQNPANPFVYYDYKSYEKWFTSMGINFDSKILAAGDNKGNMMLFNLNDGEPQGTFKLHKTKIHHIEFNKKDTNMFVTAATAENSGQGSLKLWDVRKLNLMSPLMTLPHNTGVNVARFNPVDGSRLLTSDQEAEIRVYQGPFFEEPVVIHHHHRQFQHLTPVKAEWHPLADLIVVGKYPKRDIPADGASKKNVSKIPTSVRSIEFFDPDSGEQIGEILPPLNEIVSLNVFNPTGEFLASGMNSKLVIWRPSSKVDELSSEKPLELGAISQELRDQLRGKTKARTTNRRRREYSPTSDEENQGDSKRKRARKIPTTASATETVQTSRSKKNQKDKDNAKPKN